MSSIPNSAIPHAYAEPAIEPQAQPQRKPFANLLKVAAAPAFVALGLSAFAVSALAGALKRAKSDQAPAYPASQPA